MSMFTSNIKPQTSNFLEQNLEKFNTLPLSRVRLENNALLRRTISCGRLGIEHLQRIASAHRSRNNSLNIAARNRWRRLRPRVLFALNRRGIGLGGGISNRSRNGQDAKDQ